MGSCLNLQLLHSFRYMAVKPGGQVICIFHAKGKDITRRRLENWLTFETRRAPNARSTKRKLRRKCFPPGIDLGSYLRVLT